jgi:hypothetical protein
VERDLEGLQEDLWSPAYAHGKEELAAQAKVYDRAAHVADAIRARLPAGPELPGHPAWQKAREAVKVGLSLLKEDQPGTEALEAAKDALQAVHRASFDLVIDGRLTRAEAALLRLEADALDMTLGGHPTGNHPYTLRRRVWLLGRLRGDKEAHPQACREILALLRRNMSARGWLGDPAAPLEPKDKAEGKRLRKQVADAELKLQDRLKTAEPSR